MESVLEPGRPIVDAHQHLWDRPRHRYLFDDSLNDVRSGHNIVATVYVEARSMMRATGDQLLKPVGETEFAAGIAAMSESGAYGPTRMCAAIVANADLLAGTDVARVLDAHAAAAGGRLRGIRQSTYWDSDPVVQSYTSLRLPSSMMADSRFRRGFSRLSQYGLSFDAAVFHTQIPELVALAEAFPDTPIALNHGGLALGVGRYAADPTGVFKHWRQNLRRLARCQNVYVKVGGFGIPLWGFGFENRDTRPTSAELAQVWAPYFSALLESFGAQRCMLESNSPVDAISHSYLAGWNAFKRLTHEASESERSELFSGTAAKFYGLRATPRSQA